MQITFKDKYIENSNRHVGMAVFQCLHYLSQKACSPWSTKLTLHVNLFSFSNNTLHVNRYIYNLYTYIYITYVSIVEQKFNLKKI